MEREKKKAIISQGQQILIIHTAGALALPVAKSTKSSLSTVIVTCALAPSWGEPSLIVLFLPSIAENKERLNL